MRILSAFLFAVTTVFANALSAQSFEKVLLPPEKVSLEVGQKKVLELPFAIQEHLSESSKFKVVNVENNRLTVEGTAPGNGSVTLVGGNVQKVFSVTVSGSLGPLYNALSRELGEIPGVAVTLSERTIILQGRISTPHEWEYFNKVVASYPSACSNYVRFQPGPELFEHLKKELSSAGFRTVDKISPDRPGEVKIAFYGDSFTVSGFMFCQEDIQRIEKILEAQKWLDASWNKNALQLKKDLRISDCQFDVNVVFVGISKNQVERMGNGEADGTILSWNFKAWIRNLIGKGDDASSRASGISSALNMDMRGSLAFFGENGISDFRDAGHLTVTNNSPIAAEFENGGSLNVKISNQDTANLKPIDFGLKMKIKGGFVRTNEVLLDLDLEKSLTPVKQDGDYFQRSTKTKAQIRCALGKTVVIAGQKENTYTGNGPTGYAFLRHVPVLNWFFAHEDEVNTEMYYLILVSPQLKKTAPQMIAPPVTETGKIEKTVSDRVKKREEATRAKEEKNWFLKMFTW